MAPPTVSVIVPNHNYGRYLDERLRSLLTQTFDDFELLFVDDASTDESRAVVARYLADRRVRATWFPTPSGSAYQRWNDGAAEARGKYLHFAGADDSSEPSFLETMVAVMEAHPEVGLSYSRSRVIDVDGVPQALTPSHSRSGRDYISTAAQELPHLLDQKTIPTASAVLIRRDVFERCGGFDTSFVLAADHMLWARALAQSSVAYVAQPLANFRTHGETVRALARQTVTIAERYRVYGFVFDAFGADADQRTRTRERLARNWIECWSADHDSGREARHRAIYSLARQADPAIATRLARLALERAFGVRVRGPVAVARYAWRRLRDEGHLLRGRRILWRYSAHYQRARRIYQRSSSGTHATMLSVRDVGVHVIDRAGVESPFRLPPQHDAVVTRVAAAVDRQFARTENCRFVPRLTSSLLPAWTEEIPELRNQGLVTIQLRNPLELDGLHELCEPLMAELERKLYGSFVLVDKVYAYRSPISRQQPSASWIWHFDNHPRELLKVMVYLTDVRQDTAPFEYLRERNSARPAVGAPLAPLSRPSRIPPEVISQRLASGYEACRVTGPKGTVVVFDDNVIHRANLAEAGHRDVIVFQVRPAAFEARPYISPRWTGSFLHHDFHADPSALAPVPNLARAT